MRTGRTRTRTSSSQGRGSGGVGLRRGEERRRVRRLFDRGDARWDDASRGLLAGMQCSDRRVAVHRAHKRDKLRLAGINKAHCSEMLSWMGCEGCDEIEEDALLIEVRLHVLRQDDQ